jgi:hypothetical protein
VIANCARFKVHQLVRNRVFDKKKLIEIVASTGEITIVASPHVVEAFVNVVIGENKSSANRLGNCGWKRKDDAALPSNKRKQPAHGANNFLRYQELVKVESTAASLRDRDENMSHREASKSMQAALLENGVTLHASTCRDHMEKALGNGCVGIDPQRNGGQALPSTIEKQIAEPVKHLREQSFSVFREDVLKWAEEAIEGTDSAQYFKNGKPTWVWFYGWLSLLLLLFVLLPLMLMPMLMMLALMLMFLPDAIDVAAYVAVDMQMLIHKCGMLLAILMVAMLYRCCQRCCHCFDPQMLLW